MDLLKMTANLKPVKGQRLAKWLERFLAAPPESLAQWHGTWTEVNTAKVVEILRKRGVVEEHEAQNARFSALVSASYRAPVFVPPTPEKTNSKGPQNPFEFCASDLPFIGVWREAEPGTALTNCGECWCLGGEKGKVTTAQIAKVLGCEAEAVRAILGAYFTI